MTEDPEASGPLGSTDPDDRELTAARELIASYTERFQENMTRAVSLAKLYATLASDPTHTDDPAIQDILRASVVLAHATLEDLLRTLGIRILPDARTAVLDRVPLAGLSETGRPEKFLLGRLARFRGETIDGVIRSSVSTYLSRRSYNDVTDIATFLTDLGITVSQVEGTFPAIQKMIDRRHAIVHQGDHATAISSRLGPLTPLDADEVVGWFTALLNFYQAVVTQVAILKLGTTDVQL